MLPLLLSLLVSQVSPPPPPVAESPTEVRHFIDRHLLSVDSVGWQPSVKQGARTWTLGAEGFSTAFHLVPEAEALAQRIQDDFHFGNLMFRIGSGIQLGALVGASTLLFLALGSVVAPATIIVLALACAGLALAGGVVSIVGLPAMTRAGRGFLEVVSVYNHGLTEQAVSAPLLSVALGTNGWGERPQ